VVMYEKDNGELTVIMQMIVTVVLTSAFGLKIGCLFILHGLQGGYSNCIM
jgi:hypothetical protein